MASGSSRHSRAEATIRTDAVLIKGEAVECRNEPFYIELRHNGERISKPVGSSPRTALEALQVQRALLAGKFEDAEISDENGAGHDILIHDILIKDACGSISSTSEVCGAHTPSTELARRHRLRLS